jgi:uncharacterized protein YoxC
LVFEKRSLETSLNGANRRIQQLNSDIQAIHKELNMFAENFESKLEEAIEDKQNKLEQVVSSLEKADSEVKELTAENKRLSKNTVGLTQQNEKLSAKLGASESLLKVLSATLKENLNRLEYLEQRLVQEKTQREGIRLERKSVIESIKANINNEIYEEIDQAITEIVEEKEAEMAKIVKDNIHLSKELEATRQEMLSEEVLFLPERIKKQEDDKKAPVQPKLFTQNTLLLDFPSFLDSSTNQPLGGRSSRVKNQ